MSLKDKAAKVAKDAAAKAEKLAGQAKEGVELENIKKTAEEAKNNITSGNIKGLDGKKKTMIGGVALAAVGLVLITLFSGGSSVDRMALDTPFPSDSTAIEQCNFVGSYNASIFQAAVNGDSSDSILAEMNAANTKSEGEVKRNTVEYYFYKELYSAKKKVPRLVKSISSPDFKEMSDDKISKRIAREGEKRVTKCVAAYGNK